MRILIALFFIAIYSDVFSQKHSVDEYQYYKPKSNKKFYAPMSKLIGKSVMLVIGNYSFTTKIEGYIYYNELVGYLYKDEKHSVKFPSKTDSVSIIDPVSMEESLITDTIEYIDVNHFIDSISIEEAKALGHTEIKAYAGKQRLDILRIMLKFVPQDGAHIKRKEYTEKEYSLSDLFSQKGYLVIEKVKFYGGYLWGDICWKIK